MPDVSGISANSFLGTVLIAFVVGTFLITLITFVWRLFDRKKNESNLCQIHTDEINNLKSDLVEVKSDIKQGFEKMDRNIGRVHLRIDDLMKHITTNNNPFSRKEMT